MAFKLGGLSLNAVAQGVGGLVFGKGDASENEDDGVVEALLERISNGVRVDDRRDAMAELGEIVSQNKSAQLSLGSMGFPILLSVLREEREDSEMIRSTLEVLTHALMVINETRNEKKENLNPALINCEIFLREIGSIELLISLLEDEDFYIRYHTIQILTILILNNPQRIQEVILSTPQAVTKLVDMISEREVIRNEALLLMINLTRSQEEIQKIVAFENAFEKIFNIIKEEGGCDGGIVVQDCIELVNNLLRSNLSNQIFLRETLGFSFFPSLLKFSTENHEFSRQKAANFLCALETITLLLSQTQKNEKEKENNLALHQNLLVKYDLMQILLNLTNEEYISSVAIRTQAFKALGKLISSNKENKESLGSILLEKQNFSEPSLNHILKVALQSKAQREWAASDYVLKCYCEDNTEGQNVLASTITPIPISTNKNTIKNKTKTEDLNDHENNLSFGNILVKALVGSNAQKDIEMSCRAANILSHIIKNNPSCKERILSIPLEFSSSSSPSPSSKDLLIPRLMKLIASFPSSSFPSYASPRSSSHSSSWLSSPTPSPSSPRWLQAILLRLFILWVNECPPAVDHYLLDPSHLPFLIELSKINPNFKKRGDGEGEGERSGYGEEEGEDEEEVNLHISGLSSVLLGLLVLYNPKSVEDMYNPSSIVDVINQRLGLATFFNRLNDIIQSRLFSSALSTSSLPVPVTRKTAITLLEKEEMPLSDRPQTSNGVTADGVENGKPNRDRYEEEKSRRGGEFGREILRTSVSGRGEKADLNFVMAMHLYDPEFATFLVDLVNRIRDKVSEIFSKPASTTFSLPEMSKIFSKKSSESDSDYVLRLQKYIENQAKDLHQLKQRNSVLAADLMKSNMTSTPKQEEKSGMSNIQTVETLNTVTSLQSNTNSSSLEAGSSLEDSIQIENLKSQVEEAQITIQTLFQEKKALQDECFHFKQLVSKLEMDLQGLSDAYNNLESLNFSLEGKLAESKEALVHAQTLEGPSPEEIDRAYERGKEEAREEAENEMNDLLVCLGQEESKVSKLRERLEALGVDCDAILVDEENEDGEGDVDDDDFDEDGKKSGQEED